MTKVPGLTPQQKADFHKDGFLFPLDVFEEEETYALRDAVLHHLAVSTERGGPIAALASGPKIHLLWTWADLLVRHPRLLEIARSVVGPDILVWGTSVFVKEPQGDTDLAWHQDALTYDLDGDGQAAAFRVWLALTPTTVNNGTMRFAAGTHRQGILVHHRASHLRGRMRGDEASFAEQGFDQHHVLLNPGQCSLHNMLVVHGSGINRTDEPRVTFAIDYLATSVRPKDGKPDSALLVSGTDKYGHFAHEKPPEGDMDESAQKEFHEAALLRMRRLVTAAAEKKEAGLLVKS
ncbi:phytanoyl-CoA dioxygenase family protein [Streptomyces sp. G44]|uniref:phytanoyl-CoA dioxygenase family protein n=1 Tax=Streptomyces sp. G44 TaxID=2807632 RepID=UPI00195F6AD5|nr:phytanoyl-CoA dioxygenase family protein [Streptomyces sp. G44]MBM7167519.1 phytanoyl-CoA dioxygenase family protein [Streptomyces sp. G44]